MNFLIHILKCNQYLNSGWDRIVVGIIVYTFNNVITGRYTRQPSLKLTKLNKL